MKSKTNKITKITSLILFLFSAPVFPQAIRVDPPPVMTTVSTTGVGYPQLLAVPGVTISVCQSPANGVPCTNYASTYTDATATTSCSSNKQVVIPGTSTCVSSADALGNFGFWLKPGSYTYTVTLPNGGSFGPYPITAGGSYTAPISFTYALPTITSGTDSYRYDSGNFPFSNEFQNVGTWLQSLVGTTNVTQAGTVPAPVTGMGTAGYSMASANNAYAVGGFFEALGNYEPSGGNSIDMWGVNAVANNCNYGTGCSDTHGFDSFNTYGIEIDTNLYKNSGNSQPGGNATGLWITGGSTTQPTGKANAIEVGPLGVFNGVQWKLGIVTDDNSSMIALDAGAAGPAGPSVGSQAINLHSYNSSSTRLTGSLKMDAFGDIVLLPGASNSGFAIEDSSGNPIAGTTNGKTFQLENGGLFSALPACSPTLEGAMAPVRDSSVNTWGTTVTGGGGNHVLAYCDGSLWTVAAK